MKTKRYNRDKAFLGALIGAGIGLVGTGISSIMNKNSSNKQLKEQQRQQNKNDTLAMAQNLSAGYSDQDYIDDFKNKVTFKNGGVMKNNKYGDRIKRNKTFKCGSRKKASDGIKFTNEDISSIINSTGGAASNILSSAINSSNDIVVRPGNMYKSVPKTGIKNPDYIVVADRNNSLFRCGGRKKARCGTKK